MAPIKQVAPAATDTPTAPRSEAEALLSAERFFDVACQAFEQACARTGGACDCDVAVAGERLRLRFAGRALAELLFPALEHLVIEPAATAALTIHFWDSASTGIQMPAPPWPPEAYGVRGEIAGYNNDRFRTVYQQGVNALHMLDRSRRAALYWVADAAEVPYWERSFPMRTLLHGWTGGRPLQLMHSGAVGTETGGVLIAGKSGSGKSTSTLACVEAGLLYAGDDYILARIEPEPFAYSMYGTVKVNPDTLARFPRLRGAVTNADRLEREKALVFLTALFPEQLTRGFPIRAILLPRVTGRRDTALQRASHIACLEALAPTTLFHLPGAGQEAFAKISALTHRVPGYFLDAGTDLAQIPAAVRTLLESPAWTPKNRWSV